MNLPELHNIRIYQTLGRIDSKGLERCDQLLLILPAKPSSLPICDGRPSKDARRLQTAYCAQVGQGRNDDGAWSAAGIDNERSRHSLLPGCMEENGASPFEQLSLARKLVATATPVWNRRGSAFVHRSHVGLDDCRYYRQQRTALAAALAAAF